MLNSGNDASENFCEIVIDTDTSSSALQSHQSHNLTNPRAAFCILEKTRGLHRKVWLTQLAIAESTRIIDSINGHRLAEKQ